MLRVQPLGTDVPGARAYRILYQSSTSTGVAAPSGGMAFVPVGTAPAAGRPIVAWAHPVIGDDVAPSRSTTPLSGMQPWLTEMITRGWIVVATDFVGVGTRHQEWLNGQAEAHDVTYSVEAVQQLGGADAGRQWVAWGFSYGGHAALWTGTMAAALDPSSPLVGVATAAPVAELVPLEHALGKPWAPGLLAETPPPPPAGFPALVVQGTNDTVVPVPTTALLQQQWCRAGVALEARWLPGVRHEDTAAVGSPIVLAWIDARFRRLPARGNCGQTPPVGLVKDEAGGRTESSDVHLGDVTTPSSVVARKLVQAHPSQ